MSFPTIVYKTPGPHACTGSTYAYRGVADEAALDAAEDADIPGIDLGHNICNKVLWKTKRIGSRRWLLLFHSHFHYPVALRRVATHTHQLSREDASETGHSASEIVTELSPYCDGVPHCGTGCK